MKLYLSIAAVVVIVVLAVVLGMTKHNDDAQLDTANGVITDFSNRLDTTMSRLAAREEDILTLSNTITDYASSVMTISNQLTLAQSTNAAQADQITSLNQQLADAAKEKQTLDQSIASLTSQMAALKGQLATTTAKLDQADDNLAQANKDYALLKNRFLQDVAERTIVERRFNNLAELKAQEQKLQKAGAPWVTPESIYAGLNVEVHSNGIVRVLAPD